MIKTHIAQSGQHAGELVECTAEYQCRIAGTEDHMFFDDYESGAAYNSLKFAQKYGEPHEFTNREREEMRELEVRSDNLREIYEKEHGEERHSKLNAAEHDLLMRVENGDDKGVLAQAYITGEKIEGVEWSAREIEWSGGREKRDALYLKQEETGREIRVVDLSDEEKGSHALHATVYESMGGSRAEVAHLPRAFRSRESLEHFTKNFVQGWAKGSLLEDPIEWGRS